MSLSGRIRTSLITALITGVGALFAAGCGLLSTASPAAASGKLQSMFEDAAVEGPNPVNLQGDLQTLRYLGVDVLRVGVGWAQFTRDPGSTTRPLGFNASNPNSYNWSWLRTLVDQAHRYGIGVDMFISGNAPMWAAGPGGPSGGAGGSPWEPNASDYGQFVHAVGAEFPTVHFFELWNEANWGPGLQPQYLNSQVPIAARYYRGLVNDGWSALNATGHGHDTISIGNLSQDGSGGNVGVAGTTAPLTFMKTTYCLSNSYKPLRGSAASQAGCSGSKSGFKAANPGLFNVSGVGIHPYPYGNPPTKTLFPNPNGAEFGEIPQLIRSLDRLQKAYGSHKHMSVYNTEYGYRTRPNDTKPFLANPQNAARYMNQAEYMSYKNPRIGTYEQYLLLDPVYDPATGAGWFRTGLFWEPGTKACPGANVCPKPSFYAYRLPVWLPATKAKRGKALEVWGGVRAARFARIDTHHAQSVRIQFARRGSSSYRTVKTVRLTNQYGYFDAHIKFPGSGSVRLAYAYPASDAGLTDPLTRLIKGLPKAFTSSQVYSRTTSITLH